MLPYFAVNALIFGTVSQKISLWFVLGQSTFLIDWWVLRGAFWKSHHSIIST